MPGGFPGGAMPGGFPGAGGAMPGGIPGGAMPGGVPGNIDMSKILNVSAYELSTFPVLFLDSVFNCRITLYNVLISLFNQDPDLMAAFSDPEVMAALQDGKFPT
jgi:suppressor of tumorigenicity protein 13